MPENVQLDGYVSLRLVARAAGISLNNMRQIAFDCAAGRRPSWLGSALHMRTRVDRGGRRQEIAVGSLPDVVRAELATDRLRFLVAAEQAVPGAELRHADFMLLHRAAQCDGIPPEIFARLVTNLQGDRGLGYASREQFDLTMDYLFGFGFRDTALPEIAPDYLAWLEDARTRAGLDGEAFSALLAKVGGSERPDHLTGGGFYMVVAHLYQALGVRLRLPGRHAMTRAMVGQIHLAAYRLRLPYRDHSDLVTVLGGGCLRTCGLDLRGARRVLSHHYSQGFITPEPPPRIEGARGFITQPQANLIWKLWHDHRSSQDDLSEAALAEWLRAHLDVEGGLHGLTAAGTRRVIDFMLGPLITSRCG